MDKICKYCEQPKPLNQFNKHKNNFDGYDSRCKACKKSKHNELQKIKKTAPPKPEHCECCGKKPINGKGKRKVGLVCDHDHNTKEFRGWLCQACNMGIGRLGDNLEGIKLAFKYLMKVKENNEF